MVRGCKEGYWDGILEFENIAEIFLHPIEIWNLSDIGHWTMITLILHNVFVSDRVMGDVNRQYNPEESTEDFVKFGILPQPNATIHNESNTVPTWNNINNKVPQ